MRSHPSYARTAESRPKSYFRLNFQVMTSKKFILNISGALLQSSGYLIPGYFMSSYGQPMEYTYEQGAIVIGINNAVNALSKRVIGYFADRFGRLKMLVFCCFLSCVTVLALCTVSNRGTSILFVVFYSIASGPIISLLPTCMAELFGVQNYQTTFWFLYFCLGCGTLLGSPIAGLFVTNIGLLNDRKKAIFTTEYYFSSPLSAFLGCG